jgi:hypothetical protein
MEKMSSHTKPENDNTQTNKNQVWVEDLLTFFGITSADAKKNNADTDLTNKNPTPQP